MRLVCRGAVRGAIAAALILTCQAIRPAFASTITIINADGPGEGFNDPTPAVPVGGNPGTTIGAQRLYVFQHAADIWAGYLPSNVEVRVRATFDPITPCDSVSGVLGRAGPVSVWRDFSGAQLAGHWYHVALANKLANADNDPGDDDISATFNVSVGSSNCLRPGWYYGVDGNEGSKIELLPVVLHEMGHGLGFSTTTNGSTGAYFSSFPSVYDHFLLDDSNGLVWDAMSTTQRVTSADNCKNLVWEGPAVTQRAPALLKYRPVVRVTAPGSIAGDYELGPAVFGPALNTTGVSGHVVLVDDGASPTTNACEPLVNAAAVSGNIALIDRGSCTFVTKVKNAQNAGAIAVIVADNVPGCPPPALGGSDPSITIPAVRVTQADGNILKSALASGLQVTVLRDPALGSSGADANGRVLLYTPSTYTPGSSVSHWDTSADPDLLMEPALSGSLSSDVDLTRWFFADIGWFDAQTATLLALFQASPLDEGIELRWQLGEGQSFSGVGLERGDTPSGPWTGLSVETHQEGKVTVALDRSAEPGHTYYYRLMGTNQSGERVTLGELWGTAGTRITELALARVSPNPSRGPTRIEYALPRASRVRLSVHDVQGREVAVLADAAFQPGRYQATWSGETVRGKAPTGVYFVRYHAMGKSLTRHIVLAR